MLTLLTRIFSITVATVLLVTSLSGCGPVYKTEYSYVPPKSSTGQMCITQCIQGKSSCEQMCQMRNDSCVMRARENAMYQYEAYRREQRHHHEHKDKSLSDFDTSYSCRTPCKCVPAFNMCYNACGGDVFERKTCVAFCGNEKSLIP